MLQALKANDTVVWKVLEKLLLSEDEDIRRMACYFAVKTQTKKQLTALLSKYVTRGWYFYNVVVMIDRAVYAPKDLIVLYLNDGEKGMERGSESNGTANSSLIEAVLR